MKRLIIILILLILPSLIIAQVNIVLQPIYNIWLNSSTFLIENVKTSGIGFLIKGLYSLDNRMSFGLKTGYIPWYSFEAEIDSYDEWGNYIETFKTKYSAYNLSFMALFQYIFNDSSSIVPLFEISLGIYNNIDKMYIRNKYYFNSDIYGVGGIEFGLMFKLTKHFFLTTNVDIVGIISFNNSEDSEPTELFFTPGVGIGFRI